MAPALTQRSQLVVELDEPFLRLWPHRFDFIQAPFSSEDEKARWITISTHALTDRRLLQGGALFGVRFGRETRYLMLDIDIESRYHPRRDPFALGLLRAALEPLGLVSCITLTSSSSGGLHLYFPFDKPQRSWRLADAAATLLEGKGFQIQAGQLEVFPNTKNYTAASSPSLFNAHRLPLQETGSRLLNDDLEPIFSAHSVFVSLWQRCVGRNELHSGKIARVLKSKKRRRYFVSTSAEKFLNDLNADVEPGWTAKGQTNFLFGRIMMRTFIFHHVLVGGLPLTGKALIDECIAVAKSLPGYKSFCRHQHEIVKRFTDWARSITNSHYFPYGTKSGKYKAVKSVVGSEPVAPSWNQTQSNQAQDKIREAVALLKAKGLYPEGATARFQLLKSEFHCGSQTLYRYRSLWHPEHGEGDGQREGQKFESLQSRVPASPGGAHWHFLTSLLSTNGGNCPPAEDLSGGVMAQMEEIGGNSLESRLDEPFAPLDFEALREAQRLTRLQAASQQVARYLMSDDSILVDEALLQLQHNPEMLLDDSVAQALQHAARVDEVSSQIAVLRELARLRWSPEVVSAALQARFCHSALFRLSPHEWLDWLGDLLARFR